MKTADTLTNWDDSYATWSWKKMKTAEEFLKAKAAETGQQAHANDDYEIRLDKGDIRELQIDVLREAARRISDGADKFNDINKIDHDWRWGIGMASQALRLLIAEIEGGKGAEDAEK